MSIRYVLDSPPGCLLRTTVSLNTASPASHIIPFCLPAHSTAHLGGPALLEPVHPSYTRRGQSRPCSTRTPHSTSSPDPGRICHKFERQQSVQLDWLTVSETQPDYHNRWAAPNGHCMHQPHKVEALSTWVAKSSSAWHSRGGRYAGHRWWSWGWTI